MNEARGAVEVKLEVPDGARYCEVDGRWMQIALYEVASNAIRHARRRVTVALLDGNRALHISFADDSYSARGFEPMRFRPPPGGRGLGLALAIVRDVVAAHGGELRIERSMGDAAGGRAEETLVWLTVPDVTRQEQVQAEAESG
jgi:signal transduction histidine kinase